MTGSRLVTTSRFGADLSRSLANRGKRLLEAPDLPERVPKLEPLDAYLIVKELGVDDATPILRHCSLEQLQTFVDLDCWVGDQPDAADIDAWLAPFAAEGPLVLAEAFFNLDEALQVWFLMQSLEILDATDEDLPNPPPGVVRKTTPDTYYLIQARPKLEREVPPVVLVECLYAGDLNAAFQLLTAARWEMAGTLEEQAFQFRTARVESLGFPSREVALSLFTAPVRAGKEPLYVPPADEGSSLPAVYAEPMAADSLMGRALARLTDDDLLALHVESLQHLINHAVIAYGDSPQDVAHAIDVAGRVRDTVSLGLEALVSTDGPLEDPESEANAAAAAALLERWTLFDLFRHGHGEVRGAQEQARALVEDPAIQEWRTQPIDEKQDYGEERLLREMLNGLLEVPPVHSGFNPVNAAQRKAFGSRREVMEVGERLGEIVALVG